MSEGRKIYEVTIYRDEDGRRMEVHWPIDDLGPTVFIGESVRTIKIPDGKETQRRYEFQITAEDIISAFDAFDATAEAAGAEVERHVARQALDSGVAWSHAQRRQLEFMAGKAGE